MTARTSYRVLAGVVAWIALTVLLAGLIGQHNDGPWGGLPEWLGAAAWFGFLLGLLVLVVLGVYVAAAAVRRRRSHA